MSVANLFLFFLACGAMTFPLALSAVYFAASLTAAGRRAQKIAPSFETALSLSIVVWIVGAMLFYAAALYVERQKPCPEQHTNQLTQTCKKELDAVVE